MSRRLVRRAEGDFTPDSELVGVGLYSVAEAKRIVSYAIGLSPKQSVVSRWAYGYRYRPRPKVAPDLWAESEPIIEGQLRVEGTDLLSFAELIELLVVGALRKRGLSLTAVRRLHQIAAERYGRPHPFARRRFNLLGDRMFADLQTADVGPAADAAKFVEEVERAQLAFDEIVRPLFDATMRFVQDVVESYWPLGKNRCVVLDPQRAFGKPVISGTRLTTNMIFRMVRVGGESPEAVADWYEISAESVRDACEYEAALRTAA